MYLFAFVYGVIMLPINIASAESPSDEKMKIWAISYLIVFTFSFFYFGFWGNRTWAWHLRRKGYRKISSVSSKSPNRAIGLYLNSVS